MYAVPQGLVNIVLYLKFLLFLWQGGHNDPVDPLTLRITVRATGMMLKRKLPPSNRSSLGYVTLLTAIPTESGINI
jgi:hypothetical protein